ncbi:MAG: hypothetical protein ACOCTM_03740 [Bacteroidota bacterium]
MTESSIHNPYLKKSIESNTPDRQRERYKIQDTRKRKIQDTRKTVDMRIEEMKHHYLCQHFDN